MNWSGAKSWLIVLFAAINIFLIFTLIQINTQSSAIDKQTISDTVNILKKSDITVNPDIIPDTLPKLGAIDVYNNASDTDKLAEQILGEDKSKVNEHMYTLGTKRLGFDGDIMYFSDDSPSDTLSLSNADSAKSYVIQQLRAYGFNLDSAVSSASEADGLYTVYISQKIDQYALIDSFFHVTLSQNGIYSIEGSWFCPSSEQDMFSGDSARVRSIITILFEFVRDNARINAGSNEIVGISLGYITGDKQSYHKHSSAMPMWCIKCSDGNEYYYNAR